MKKIFFLLLAVVMLFGLWACTKTGKKVDALPGSVNYKIYCLTNEETELVSETFYSNEKDTRTVLRQLIERLEQPPEDISCKRAKPEPVKIKDFDLKDDGKLTLNFNSEYRQVTGLSEVLMRAAIVKTLCQAPGVDSIEFNVDGQPLMENEDKPVGFMKGENIIDNTGDETNFYQNANLSLYFSTSNGQGLTTVPVSIKYDGTITLEQLIIRQLIAGPDNISGVNTELVKATIPDSVTLNAVSVVEGICYVDFSPEFLKPMEGIDPQVSIYSVVNSLVELSHIDKVEIIIDGKSVVSYQDTVEMNQTFERNLDLME